MNAIKFFSVAAISIFCLAVTNCPKADLKLNDALVQSKISNAPDVIGKQEMTILNLNYVNNGPDSVLAKASIRILDSAHPEQIVFTQEFDLGEVRPNPSVRNSTFHEFDIGANIPSGYYNMEACIRILGEELTPNDNCQTKNITIAKNPEPLVSENISYDNLKELILYRNITKIEDLIHRLPVAYKQDFTLMRASNSRQGASANNPRAILYGPNAKIVLTFNGNDNASAYIAPRVSPQGVISFVPATMAQSSAYYDLEIMTFSESDKRFEFRFMSFPRPTTVSFADDLEYEYKGQRGVAFSKANPSACMACHGTSRTAVNGFSDPRPIWEPWELWHGAYGARDDVAESLPGDTQVVQNFIQTSGATHPRYRELDLQRNFGTVESGWFKSFNNQRFTARLQKLNFDRIFRALQQDNPELGSF